MARHEFDEFFSTHYDHVARALTLATGDREAAQEAAQEGFTKALRHWRRVRDAERPEAWVYVAAMNHLRDGWRSRQRRQSQTEPTVVAADPSGVVATRLALREAIATLSPRQREAIVLRYFADLALADIADAMGCAVGTVKATLHQALNAMRLELDEEDDDANG